MAEFIKSVNPIRLHPPPYCLTFEATYKLIRFYLKLSDFPRDVKPLQSTSVVGEAALECALRENYKAGLRSVEQSMEKMADVLDQMSIRYKLVLA